MDVPVEHDLQDDDDENDDEDSEGVRLIVQDGDGLVCGADLLEPVELILTHGVGWGGYSLESKQAAASLKAPHSCSPVPAARRMGGLGNGSDTEPNGRRQPQNESIRTADYRLQTSRSER